MSKTFVTWLWRSRTRDFTAQHVNVLHSMLKRHCGAERLVCITDTPDGLDPDIESMRMPETGLEQVINPALRAHPHKKFPSCYRRLWLFSGEAEKAFGGDQIVCIDIDVIVLRECSHLFERDEDFIGWSDEKFGWNKIAGGMFMLRTGTNRAVWDGFDPETSPERASAAGFKGSDQGWMAFMLYPTANPWSADDGLVKINWTPSFSQEVPNANIVFTNGHKPPWHLDTKRRYPWIRGVWH